MQHILILFNGVTESIALKTLNLSERVKNSINLGDKLSDNPDYIVLDVYPLEDREVYVLMLCKYLRICISELPIIRPDAFNTVNYLMRKIELFNNITPPQFA